MSDTLETVVVGTFDRPEQAQRAADELRSAGFRESAMMLAGREGAGTSSAGVGTEPQELEQLLGGWQVTPEVANRVALNAGGAHAMLVLRPGPRQQDAIRILKDFGARIFGNVSDADWEAANVERERGGYDTTVGTRATFPGAENVPTDQLGALTGREVSWDEAHPHYRRDWQQRTGGSDEQWRGVEPGYRYAYEMRRQPGYDSRDWATAEPQLRDNYDRWARQRGYHRHSAGDDQGLWDEVKDAVRDAWDRVTFKQGPVSEVQPVQPVQPAGSTAARGRAPEDRPAGRRWVRMSPWGGGMTGTPGVTVDNPDTERPAVVEREVP